MCEPLALVALGLTAAGTYAQYQGQRQANKAMTAAAEAESRRQGKLRDEAQGLFNESLGKQNSDSQTQRLADAQSEREAATVGNQTNTQVVNVPVQGGAPNIVADETAARVGEGNIRARDEATAKAALAAFGDLQLGNALMNARYGAQQGQLANFMQGSAGVLPTEMAAASRRGDKTKLLGDILVAGGQVAGMYGLANGFGGAASASNASNGIVGRTGLQSLQAQGVPAVAEVGTPLWQTASPAVNYGRVAPGTTFAKPVILSR